MSEVFASSVPPASPWAVVEPVELDVSEEPEEPDDESSLDEHAVSATASPAAPTAANAVRREGAVTGSNESLVMLTFLP
jgi:hypothetical protein